MTYKEDIDSQVDDYAAIFDLYIEQGKVPQDYQDDPISEYIGSQVCIFRNVLNNQDMREVFRDKLLGFIREILPDFLEIQERHRQEEEMIRQFFGADIPGRRARWKRVRTWLEYHYSESDFNMEGYERMFSMGDKTHEQVFSAMQENWNKCLQKDCQDKQLQLLYYGGNKDKPKGRVCGEADFKKKLKVNRIILKYPQLDEILKMIGREKESDSSDRDMTITVDIPILLRHSKSRQEIDGVTNGNDLGSLLPVEYAIMDQPSFYVRYQRRELQQFSSRPPTESRKKTDTVRTPQPRLEKGPIILAIDTSGSMTGQPMEISKALLDRTAIIARRQKRSCFLITFSVRARYLDIARPSQYGQIDRFFADAYSGGTDGEEMFKAALNALACKTYSMADVLIISDFIFSAPMPATARRIAEEQAKGTRFYGLAIGGDAGAYRKYLDKYWTI